MTERPTDLLDRTVDPRPVEPDTELEEFFGPEFMAENSRFGSIEAFWAESPWTVDGPGDIDPIPRSDLDRYVAETTRFDHWVAMRNKAAEHEIRRRHLL